MKTESILLPLILASIVIAGCDTGKSDSASAMPVADKILLTNSRVYTVEEDMPIAQAVAITGNKISFVGTREEALKMKGPNTEISDLGERAVLPGFVSGHDHVIASGWMTYGLDLNGMSSEEEVLGAIKEFADANPDDEFVLGFGWNPGMFGGNYPTRHMLDKAIPGRKAMFFDWTVHDMWFSTPALEAGGIDNDVVDPEPGLSYWQRDDKGELTGIAVELSWMTPYITSGAWNPEKIIGESAEKLTAWAAQSGWTTITNQGVVSPNIYNYERNFEDTEVGLKKLTDMKAKGELPVRVHVMMMYKNPEFDIPDFVARTKELQSRYNDDIVSIAGIKGHAEGNVVSNTAVLIEPYADAVDGEFKGESAFTVELLSKLMAEANRNGLNVHTHTDGDGLARRIIDAIVKAREETGIQAQNTLQHATMVHPDDIKRMGEYGIGANMTPLWGTDWAGSVAEAMSKVGPYRLVDHYSQVQKMLEAGVVLSLSGDQPGSPYAYTPLYQVQAAMTHKEPGNPEAKPFPNEDKTPTLTNMVKAITIWPAQLLEMDDRIGTIQVGKYADLTILEKDLLDVSTEDIHTVKVHATMMDGVWRYRAE